MSKITILKGLPGSGNSTFAASQVGATVVNKDDIRLELGEDWSPKMESKVIQKRDFRIGQVLSHGGWVISSDTNLAPKHEKRLREIAAKYKSEVEINDSFLQVPLEVCIERDLQREWGAGRVGEKVIRGMYEQFKSQFEPPTPPLEGYQETPGLPWCILCDLDGTLSLFEKKGHRGPYDAAKCDQDEPNPAVVAVLNAIRFQDLFQIIFMSGREDKFKPQTLTFLKRVGMADRPLYMRKSGDMRKDCIVKEELLRAHIFGKFNVSFCLDDRNQVVDHYRKLGLTVFQVAPGKF